jgi:16S rRNA (adenine1518-N6/adenine1519-N6)-dimethyltransferase
MVAPSEMKALSALVGAAFAHRRKTLRNNLKGLLDADRIESLGIDPGARSETLPVADFIGLYRAVEAKA